MKILFLTPWYPDDKSPNHGIFVRDQAAALQRVHQVVVVSAKVDYSAFAFFSYTVKESNFRDVKEYRISVKRSIPFLNQLVFFCIATRQAVRISKVFSPDVIHGNIGYPGAFWSWRVSKRMRKPYVVTEHTSRFTANFRSIIHKFLTIYSLKQARGIISVSSHSAKEISVFI
ncbi:MAG TPA: glycosyltransferase, partial [Cyclobacteriaceae bacterium]|nr:glycosyltransferase [Cyclobacteriaceae bacterium]